MSVHPDTVFWSGSVPSTVALPWLFTRDDFTISSFPLLFATLSQFRQLLPVGHSDAMVPLGLFVGCPSGLCDWSWLNENCP